MQDAELLQVQALASNLTAAASPVESLETAGTATTQPMESVRGASNTSGAALDGSTAHAAGNAPPREVEDSGEDHPANQVLSSIVCSLSLIHI